ncbi:deoxycytidine kinase 2-like isoform X2 [Halichondria panicea]|uniref:deoxycytidine kinase 2-like isoform X2 n=1 Tax=Halichondria panicea TaxID=6063 RepID=UPI00312B5B52
MAELAAPLAKRLCTAATAGSVKRIAIEGNIAAGKSTFLRLLEELNPTYRVISEPLTKWLKVPAEGEDVTESQQNGGNLLDMFYKEPNRWAYTFQTYACVSRLRSQLRPVAPEVLKSRNPVVFYERSVYSDRFIFAQNCHLSGLMSDMEWNLYCDWHSFLTSSLPVQLDGIIYLRTDPKICYGRLQKRGRPEEDTVSQTYLETLHERHEDWLIHKSIKSPSHLSGVPVLSLNCDSEFEQNKSRMEDMMKSVAEFVEDGLMESTVGESSPAKIATTN